MLTFMISGIIAEIVVQFHKLFAHAAEKHRYLLFAEVFSLSAAISYSPIFAFNRPIALVVWSKVAWEFE